MFTLYHNPRCSKSRSALQILQENNVENLHIKEYLKDGLRRDELKELLGLLKKSPGEIIRSKEKIIQENNINLNQLDDHQLMDLMVEYPSLLERPILKTDDSAVIGRPPENILSLLS